MYALCDWATYLHLGRQAAMILTPLKPSLFDARLRLVIALISGMALAIAIIPKHNRNK
jgi:hypothetical protein